MRSRLAALALLAVVGCGTEPVTTTVPVYPAEASGDTATAPDASLWCMGVSFQLRDWEQRSPLAPDDELFQAAHEDLVADYGMLDPEEELGGPVEELQLVVRGDTQALLVMGGQADDGSARPPVAMELNRDEQDGWQVMQLGGCVPEVRHPDGAHRATWEPVGRPGPDTSHIDVRVMELGCAGGQPADDRLLPPQVKIDDQRVVITWFVEPLPGGATCPGNPTTTVAVELPEPLGDRELLDGGVHPPRPPDLDP